MDLNQPRKVVCNNFRREDTVRKVACDVALGTREWNFVHPLVDALQVVVVHHRGSHLSVGQREEPFNIFCAETLCVRRGVRGSLLAERRVQSPLLSLTAHQDQVDVEPAGRRGVPH